jgi:adenylosuccinate synthase
LREYNTRSAFDAENGKKGGVASVEEEVERYRGWSKQLRRQIIDSVTFMHEDIARGSRVLVEGANAAMLDIDFGTYPFVTSSNTTIGGVCTGLGVPPRVIDYVVGVVKAYTTRVGFGPFPTELQNEKQVLEDFVEEYIGAPVTVTREGDPRGPYALSTGDKMKVGEMLQEVGREYGTTTGRRRRCGWLDIPLVKYSAMVNGFTSLSLTKLDVLTGLKQIRVAVAYRLQDMSEVRLPSSYFPSHLRDLEKVDCEYETLAGWSEDISQCRSFAQLPNAAQVYILRIQELVGVPISSVGVGPDRLDLLTVNQPL